MTWYSESRPWSSGPWSLELRGDELADLRFGGRPVLRSIRAVVRDRNWDTADLVVDALTASDTRLRMPVHTAGLGSDLRGSVLVSVDDDRLTVSLELVAGSEFWTNRTGLVVLHPAQSAGAALRVRHADDAVEQLTFPEEISPHQPVRDISELSWTDNAAAIDLRFHGDVFEMEDQRNWTDASFKTYSRPLALPFPYRLAQRESVQQSVEVHVRALAAARAHSDRARVVLTEGGAFPALSLGASTAPASDAASGVAFEGSPIGAAVLVELDLHGPHWRDALSRAASSGLPLDVRLVPCEEHPEALRQAAQAMRELGATQIARVAAFAPGGPEVHVSDAATVTALRSAMAEVGLDVPVVGGARSHFTELNREWERLPHDLVGIVFSITPLFHSRSTEQLVESLSMQRLVARQAVGRSGGTPVHIGPVTLRPRFNDVSTSPAPQPSSTDLAEGYGPELLDSDDPRQGAPQLAAWTIASAAALAIPGVASLTFFEEWGPRGIREESGADLPVADAIRAIAELAGTHLLHGDSVDGLVWAIGGTAHSGALGDRLAGGDATRELSGEVVLVANVGRVAREVTLVTPAEERTITVEPGSWTRLSASRMQR